MDVIKVACVGAAELPLEDMQPFQGKLKTLDEHNYEKLKAVILRQGISEPISIWTHQNVNWILNGHQRHTTLSRMKAEGFDVPPIPVSIVHAESLKEAKEKCLTAAAQYGKVSDEGLKEYLQVADIDFSFAEDFLRMPEINFDYLSAEIVQSPEKKMSITEKEYQFGSIKQIILIFGEDEFTEAMEIIGNIISKTGLDTNTDAIMEALRFYANNNSE